MLTDSVSKWIKTGRYMQNCYPFSKFDGLGGGGGGGGGGKAYVEISLGGGGGGGAKHMLKYHLGGGGGAKHMLKYHLQFFVCLVCSFFVIVVELMRFCGPSIFPLRVTFIFCGNHEGHDYNWPKPNHSKTPQIANCMHESCDAPYITHVVVGWCSKSGEVLGSHIWLNKDNINLYPVWVLRSFDMCINWANLFYGIAMYLFITIFREMLKFITLPNPTKPRLIDSKWQTPDQVSLLFRTNFIISRTVLDNITCWFLKGVCNLFSYNYIAMTYH